MRLVEMCDLFFASPLWFIVYCTRRSSATVLEICRPSKIVHSASCSHSSDNDIIAVSAHTERRRGCRACRIFHVAGRIFCGLLSQTIRGTSAARGPRQWHKNVIRTCRYISRDHNGYYFGFCTAAAAADGAMSGVCETSSQKK